MSNYNERILIVEDDAQIRNYLNYILLKEGFITVTCSTAQTAMNHLVSEQIDLMLLDLGLPDIDGLEVIKKVREWSEIPIIVVSARDQDKEKVTALNSGADDYLTKPFSATELMARIKVAIRHLYRRGNRTEHVSFEVGELKVDYVRRQVWVNGEEVHLTPMEYSMMLLLAQNAGKVLTTGTLLKEIWGANYGSDTQALRTLMAALRRKVEDTPAKPRYILTEIGVGYRLVDE